jgi:hypothetical protein
MVNLSNCNSTAKGAKHAKKDPGFHGTPGAYDGVNLRTERCRPPSVR